MRFCEILVGGCLKVLLGLDQVRLDAEPVSVDDTEAVVALALALSISSESHESAIMPATSLSRRLDKDRLTISMPRSNHIFAFLTSLFWASPRRAIRPRKPAEIPAYVSCSLENSRSALPFLVLRRPEFGLSDGHT